MDIFGHFITTVRYTAAPRHGLNVVVVACFALVIFRCYSGIILDHKEDNMHVRLSEVDENYIKGKVESGFYTSENEVVRDAVRGMRERERIARFQAAVRIGDEQIERGETVPYSQELMAQISQRAVQRASKANHR